MKEYGSHLQDVSFTNADNAYLPDFLILEQNIKGNRCVTKTNQLIVSLLLMFLSNYHLGNIQKCHRVIKELSATINGTCSKEIAILSVNLNCLGYCYLLLGNEVSAY